MSTPLTRRLYFRIWLAVVATVTLLTLLFGWLWREESERMRAQRPVREIVVRNADGQVIGAAQARPVRTPGQGVEFEIPMHDGQTLFVQLPRPPNRAPPIHPLGWWRPPYSVVWLFIFVALAVALGAYPIVRRLTKRLEALQQGVERWGEGDLSRRLPEEGHDEVAFLAQRFNIAAQRVQSLLLSHKALLANASHELRSPLARIRMGLELLDKPHSEKSREEIARNIHELDQLIDEILLASRLDSAAADSTSLEAADLVGLCAEECARTGADLDVLSDPSKLELMGDARLLRRALRNLLENAHRHGDGAVALQLQRVGQQIEARVCDHGPGVPPDLRERIFDPFYRLPGASERDGGVGLGLALVKSIAHQHGGNVRCDSQLGGGACFVLSLPLAR